TLGVPRQYTASDGTRRRVLGATGPGAGRRRGTQIRPQPASARSLRQRDTSRRSSAPHPTGMKERARRLCKGSLVGVAWIAGIFLLMQVVPCGRTHSNPVTIQEPPWSSARTRELAVRACFNCHSNQTQWPWYANVAPLSWVVEADVDGARSTIN